MQTALMRTDKEKIIIALKRQGKNIRQIAEQTQSSFSTISSVLKEADEEERIIAQKKIKLEQDDHASATYSRALVMFSQGKTNIDVAKITGLKADEIISIRKDYWKLIEADELAQLHEQVKPYLSSLLNLDKRMRRENIDQDDIVWSLNHFKELRFLRDKIIRARANLERLQDKLFETHNAWTSLVRRKQRLEAIIQNCEYQISSYREKFKSFREFEAIGEELDKKP